MFKNPLSFAGRIRRTESALSILIFYAGICIGVSLIDVQPNNRELLAFFILLPLYAFLIAQRTKRCHDRGNSGWFQVIPLYGLWMLFADSESGFNRFGPNPKGILNQ
jgi:uncharacterized membrane protein YhaH (DUF805 family)